MQRAIAVCFSLIFLCSCATQNSVRINLPADASMNTLAGRGDDLFVKLHLEDGRDLIFAVDNGFPCTVLDKSLEPELGKPSGTQKVSYAWYANKTITVHKYKSPKLYLGNTPLMLDASVITDDLKQRFQGRPVVGILGMDCLKHYCIQLDFASKKIHFLDPDHLQSENLGKPFPLAFSFIWSEPSTRMDFCGKDVWFGLDTGDYTDGTLKSALLDRTMKTHSPDKVLQTKPETGGTRSKIYFSELEFGGETYTNLLIHKSSDGPDNNALGLQFLARNLVTFNFPKRTMYLKQISVGPLKDKNN
ncbi:MAG TPA: hypothetical protein VIK59_04045 [Verrucomicrobiae bacterium]